MPVIVCEFVNDGTIEIILFTSVTDVSKPEPPLCLIPFNALTEPLVLGIEKMRFRETVVPKALPNCMPVTELEVLRSRTVFSVIEFVPAALKAIPVNAVVRAADSKIVFPVIVQLSFPVDVEVMPLVVKLLSWLLEMVLFLFGMAADVPAE